MCRMIQVLFRTKWRQGIWEFGELSNAIRIWSGVYVPVVEVASYCSTLSNITVSVKTCILITEEVFGIFLYPKRH